MLFSLTWLCLLVGGSALNPIIVRGTKMYDSVTKERFMMRGIAYAPDKYFNRDASGDESLVNTNEDLLDDDHESWWRRDIPYLQELGVNVIRIYEIDPFKSHAKIMKALEDIGVYVIVGLTKSSPEYALPAGTPSPGCFRTSMMDSVERIISNMGIYNNLLAFVAGNEVDNSVPLAGTNKVVRGYLAMPCVKALARDARNFMKNCPQMRSIPLMYAATDYPNPPKQVVADYLSCDQTDSGGAVDIYGINVYTWCARAATLRSLSTYGNLVDQFAPYNIPTILSEYGCNQGDFKSTFLSNWTNQRLWEQSGIKGIFSTEMAAVFSGGLAYQYSMTWNDFGIVLLPGYQANQPNVVRLQGFYNLKAKNMEAYNLTHQRAEMGAWTTETECTWVPIQGKSPPACPSLAQIQQTFDSSDPDKFNTTEYPPSMWYDPLPTLTRTSLTCPVVLDPAKIPMKCSHAPPTPPTAAVPTMAPTMGNCTGIPKLPGCDANVSAWVAGGGNPFGNFFGALCGTFADRYPEPNWCTNNLDVAFAACTTQQKVDLILYTWAKFGLECCINLKDIGGACVPYDFSPPPSAAPTAAPTTGVSPTTGSSPTTAGSPTSVGSPTSAGSPTNQMPPTPKGLSPTSLSIPPTIALPPSIIREGAEEGGQNNTTVVVVSVSAVLVLIVAMAVFCVYRRKKRFDLDDPHKYRELADVHFSGKDAL